MTWHNPFRHRSTQSASFSQNDQNAPSQPWVDWRSNKVKTLTKQQFSSNLSFSEIFGNFDPVWPNLTWSWLLAGPKNLNSDPVVRTGWNWRHCEDYQIHSPTTIHGSKSKLERPRYHENRVNTSIDALLTSESHNFWSDRWIFKFHTFSETGSQDLSKGAKINPVQGLLKVEALEGPSPRKSCWGYKRP